MRRIFFIIVICLLLATSFLSSHLVFAADVPASGSAEESEELEELPPLSGTPLSNVVPGEWIQDSTVTFMGKTASRSANFMDWALTNYKWDYSETSLQKIWVAVRNIVYAMFLLAVLIGAFFIIISGGKKVGIILFAKNFIFILLLVTFSFALVRFAYQITDIFQVFFVNIIGNGTFAGKDIVNISFPYQTFVGYRKIGAAFDEAAFVNLILIKLSAVTFYVIGFILTIRKIILWFFIAVSPFYPIVLLYFPLKNTARIWMYEFLRWLLYAPLFCLFLSAVVIIWRSDILVLPFKYQQALAAYFPTATSILLGGPGQKLSVINSLNSPDTFMLYIVALLMLWIAIIMPFILLKFLLDSLAKSEFGQERISDYIIALQNNFKNNGFAFPKKPIPPSPSPIGQAPTGDALEIVRHYNEPQVVANQEKADITSKQKLREHTSSILTETTTRQRGTANNTSQANRKGAGTFGKQTTKSESASQGITNASSATHSTEGFIQKPTITDRFKSGIFGEQTTKSESTFQGITNTSSTTNQIESFTQIPTLAKFKSAILAQQTAKLVSFPIPTIRDIVKFEIFRLNKTQENTHALQQVQETLQRIANPQASTTLSEKQHYTTLRDKLSQERTKGDVLAKSILTAASSVEKPQTKETTTSSTPTAPTTPSPTTRPQTPITFPVVNQVQTVSFDDYEAVKALWLENYQQIDVPQQYTTRRVWVEEDEKKVSEAITLLSSPDPLKVREGLASVSNILPFLLIGGFSQTEVIAYLKAKLAAGKAALQEFAKKEENKETLLENTKREEKKQLLQQAQEEEESAQPS